MGSQRAKALYLLDVEYDGKLGKAVMKFYDEEEGRLVELPDGNGHKPYLLTDLSPEALVQKHPDVLKHRGFDHLEVVEKYDPLQDRNVLMTKVIARDPLSIGGTRGALRELLKDHAWEARIRYHHCYAYDTGLIPGMPYVLSGEGVKAIEVEIPESIVTELRKLYGSDEEQLRRALEWAKLFQAPVPLIKRVSLDIEVYSPEPNRVPRPNEAPYPVIAVSLCASDGYKRTLLLVRPELGDPVPLENVEYFNSERELLRRAFEILRKYPVVLTFNGDAFDLPYLRIRALKLGFSEDEIPVRWERGADYARLKSSLHIDLYKFFTNKSMKTYAFGGKYREGRSLDEISEALLGVGKVKPDRPIPSLNYTELVKYSLRDAELTYALTSFNDDLVLKLMVLMMRVSKLGVEDLTRHNISTWIRSLLHYEHRRRGYLIPNEEDIRKYKGYTDTRAVIKGKKYLGAVVIDPPKGIFFNVTVVDFASLYPSVIKRWNLSYETVRCPHEDCKSNTIPGLSHWVCTKQKGIMSEIVGFLRDFRVHIYKKLAKTEDDPMRKRHYDVVQSALKVFINASYGVFGAETFPLYCPPVAEATTALGRYLMVQTLRRALELGLPVLYGDTDSLFLWNPQSSKLDELISWVRDLQVDLDIDKRYVWVAFSGRKKNYVGILDNGLVDAKGIVGKKRNTPELIKGFVMQVIDLLSATNDLQQLDNAIEELKKFTYEYYMKLKKKEVPLSDLIFKVALTKPLASYVKTTPQHVKAARQLQRMGMKVEVGDIIFFVKVRGSEGVKAVQLARIDEIDPDKYIEHLRTALEQVLEALGTSFDEIITGAQLL
ncbi:MAG: DNA-directed DNA polymerase I [Thermofilaceae archaeon]